MIELADKKRFVSWLIQCVTLKKRESYWILNYLLNHDAILNRVSFVQGALNTPRGILMTDQSILTGPGLEMSKQKHLVHEADQIFYDIRKNRKEVLFIEVIFDGMEESNYYLSVLEENQYQPIDAGFEKEFSDSLAIFLEEEEKNYRIKKLSEAIDKALEEKNEQLFLKLTDEYLDLKEQANYSKIK